jgi:RNA-directed DNA polymerase
MPPFRLTLYRTKRRETLAKECRQITTFIVKDNENINNSQVSPQRDGLKNA